MRKRGTNLLKNEKGLSLVFGLEDRCFGLTKANFPFQMIFVY